MGERRVIFAIDDEAENLKLLERSLPDYQLQTFTDPKDALEQAGAVKPSGFIVDYKMPSMNGVELLKAFRERGLTGAAVMITAYPDLDDVVFAEQTKLVYQIVAKPYEPRYLPDILQLAMIQSRVLTQNV